MGILNTLDNLVYEKKISQENMRQMLKNLLESRVLMSFLNFFVELTITKSEGSAFQIGIIRVEKKYFLTTFLAIGVASFKGCPRMVDKLG